MFGLSLFKTHLAVLAATFAISFVIPAPAHAACEVTACRNGGSVPVCWSQMRKEVSSKRKSCGRVAIGSGVSAYAMAMALPGTCIKPGATIGIHRPYSRGLKAVPIGSYWHNFYFGRIRPAAVSYFRSRGGMTRDGLSNAMQMIRVPAKATGIPLCRASS